MNSEEFLNENLEFDAVKMMRVIRNRRDELYAKNRELWEKRLREIRKKYGIKTEEVEFASTDLVFEPA